MTVLPVNFKPLLPRKKCVQNINCFNSRMAGHYVNNTKFKLKKFLALK